MPACKDPEKEKERRRKLSEGRTGEKNWNFGKSFDQEHKDNLSKSLKGRVITPEWREKLRLAAIGRKASVETKKKMSKAHSGEKNGFHGKKHDPLAKKIMSEKAMGREPSYDSLSKNTEAQLGGFWYGNVRYPNRIVCVKWDDVNARVHAFFDNRCIVCGKAKEQGDLAPAGHHVFYETKACCWYNNDDGVYYTNLNAKDHKEKDYLIGDNPNYFVLLCQSCHGKSNGTFENRKKWADMLKKIVDEQYNGKCYYTKEEFKTLKELGRL